MFSQSLDRSLYHALAFATERHHEYATLEHLLLALIEDLDAVTMLRACRVDLDQMHHDILDYVNNGLTHLASSRNGNAKPTVSFQRVLQRASVHVNKQSGREEVTGADVLVAMFAEYESHAIYFLQEQGITMSDAVKAA